MAAVALTRPAAASLLFAASTLVSAYTLQYYKFHGNLPGYDTRRVRGGEGSNISNIDPDKAAFSMAPHDDEAYERVHMDDHDALEPAGAGGYADADRYGRTNPYATAAADDDDNDDPSRYGALPPRTNDLFNVDSEYGSAAGVPAASMPYGGAAAASHVSYSDEPAKFPAGNYDRVHS